MRRRLRVVRLLLISGLGFGVACSSPSEARVSRLGVLHGSGEDLEIEVPDSARARAAFDISVKTSGNGCVSFGGTEVEVTDRIVNFKPFDLSPEDGDTLCFSILNIFEHRAAAQFDTPGTVVVRIHGRVSRFDGSRDKTSDTVVVRTVEVVLR